MFVFSSRIGRTLPSFRIAVDIERGEWKPFRQYLEKEDRKKFDEMFSIASMYNSACSYRNDPVVIRPVMMSIIFHHYKQLLKLKGQLKDEDTNIKPIIERPKVKEFSIEEQEIKKEKTLLDYL